MGFLLLYCLLFVLSLKIAQRRGQNLWGNAIIAILLSPLLSILIAFIMEKRPVARATTASFAGPQRIRLFAVPVPGEPGPKEPQEIQLITGPEQLAESCDEGEIKALPAPHAPELANDIEDRAYMASIEREAIAWRAER